MSEVWDRINARLIGNSAHCTGIVMSRKDFDTARELFMRGSFSATMDEDTVGDGIYMGIPLFIDDKLTPGTAKLKWSIDV